MSDEQTAERIAARGREALVARLRPAFEEAASAHSDVLDLKPDQIEQMVQRAADRADGLQWRRALAAVATEELGIGLGEALGHPAVIKAHELIDAPSYEDSLAELGPIPSRPAAPAATPAPPAPKPAPVTPAPEPVAAQPEPEPAEPEPEPAEPEPEPEAVAEPEPEEDDEDEDDLAAGPEEIEAEEATSEEPVEDDIADGTADAGEMAADAGDAADEESEDAAHDDEPIADPDATQAWEVVHSEDEPPAGDEDDVDAALATLAEATGEDSGDPGTAEYAAAEGYDEEYYDEDDALRVSVVHLGGIANLAPAERDIELLMSEDGLDIIRGSSDVLGRLEWDQVRALEVPLPRGRRRMRKPGPTHLVIRTARGDASFEVPEVSPAELRQHLAPVIAEHVQRG